MLLWVQPVLPGQIKTQIAPMGQQVETVEILFLEQSISLLVQAVQPGWVEITQVVELHPLQPAQIGQVRPAPQGPQQELVTELAVTIQPVVAQVVVVVEA
jgi:hypothetical protein